MSNGTTEDDFENTVYGPANLANKRVLVLNADYTPISYRPLSTIPWTKAFFWLAKSWDREREGKRAIITVVEEYDDIVHSATKSFHIPSVVAFNKMMPMGTHVPFNTRNIYLRDGFRCQYSGVQYPESELTLDHVIPKSRGGGYTWENLVTCHRDINYAKADRTPKEAGLRLLRTPYEPTVWEMRERGRHFPIPLDDPRWSRYVVFAEDDLANVNVG